MAARKIVILGTGGTIAGLGAADGGGTGYRAAQLGVAQLLAPMEEWVASQGWEWQAEQVAQVDSKDMDAHTWAQLIAACQHWLAQPEVGALVITHGTDTLEETAWLLQCVLGAQIPVVMTCAMRPANAVSADGPGNLRDAVVAAMSSELTHWAVQGYAVTVAVAGAVHAAQWVRKVHPYRLNAFDSAPHSPLGWVEERQVRAAVPLASLAPQTRSDLPAGGALPTGQAMPAVHAFRAFHADTWPWVEIITSTAAARGEVVDALVQAGVQGLVVAATGNGSIHQALESALARAEQAGVWVRRTTRCEQGVVVEDPHHSDGRTVALSPVKARIALALERLAQQP